MQIAGRCRDLLTPADSGAPQVLAEETLLAGVTMGRVIEKIACDPPRPSIGRFVGARGGGHLRSVIDEVLPGEREEAKPLYLLLDDISGSSLVGGWAWSRWPGDWMVPPPDMVPEGGKGPSQDMRRQMEGVCIGFRPGSSALNRQEMSGPSYHNTAKVPPLPHPDDPDSWHALTDLPEVSMRRARRIDVWQSDVIEIDATFQDSASVPEGGRVAIHEYKIRATADLATRKLTSVEADPRILPFPECPAATGNVARLVGTPLNELRAVVLTELRKTAGCTHLNDALRALAEVPILLDHLPAESP